MSRWWVVVVAASLAACGAGSDGSSHGDDASSGPDGGANACQPSCALKQCGPDGCGGSCGSCGPSFQCDASFQCVAVSPSCVPSCAARACGDDGCGGSCGTCTAGTVCQQGSCVAQISSVCGAGLRCFYEKYTAYQYACAPTCTQTGSVIGEYAWRGDCIVACSGGPFSCPNGEGELECEACRLSCDTGMTHAPCPAENQLPDPPRCVMAVSWEPAGWKLPCICEP